MLKEDLKNLKNKDWHFPARLDPRDKPNLNKLAKNNNTSVNRLIRVAVKRLIKEECK